MKANIFGGGCRDEEENISEGGLKAFSLRRGGHFENLPRKDGNCIQKPPQTWERGPFGGKGDKHQQAGIMNVESF